MNNNNWINGIDHPQYIDIARVLAHSEAKGKGEFYVNTEKFEDGSLLLALTRYGNSFVYYMLNIEDNSCSLFSGRDITPPYANPLDE